MARIEIEKQASAAGGSALTFGAVSAAAAPDGNYFLSNGSEVVLIKNAGAAPHTMTVDVPVIVDGVTVADRVVTVAAGATVQWRPKDVHRQPGTGQVHINFDNAVDVTVAIIGT